MSSLGRREVAGCPRLPLSGGYRPTRTRARVGGKPEKAATNPQPATGRTRKAPPAQVTILRHCRCQDCEHWIRHPHNECRHGIISNGVKERPEYPADAWHYCALYRGPQISKDVFVWPRATNR